MSRTPLTMLLALAACGSDGGLSDDAGAGDANSDSSVGPTLDERRAAAQMTAQTHTDCVAIGDFYWEIGDDTARLGQGAIGSTYTATTRVPIASASKIVFGAYVVQRTNGALTAVQKKALLMTSGNIGMNPLRCGQAPSISACLGAGTANPNFEYAPGEVDRFYYNGAHDQVLAANSAADGGLAIGALSETGLAAEIAATFGFDAGIGFTSPQPAGGANATPEGFAMFLRAIMDGTLLLGDRLGDDAVCTLPAACATATSSPSPFAWHYSYNHWIEDDAEGDGSFSSAGALGFYPWITADKKLYGIVSRQSELGGGFDSVVCGKLIRRAWVTAQVQ